MKDGGRRFGAREWFTLVVLAAVAALARPGALRAPFFADDWLFLDQARARSLFATLASPDPIGNFARPLGRQVWFWLMGHVSGESTAFFHLASLGVFIAAVGSLFRLGWRLGGIAVGAIAAGFFALHYSADVPLTWASGSQDLLAVALGIASVTAFVEGRRVLAAALLFAGLLCKETIVLLPLPAIVFSRRPGEPWSQALRRAWPFGAAWLAWLGVVALAAARGRAHLGGLPFQADSIVAALILLFRTSIGLEWRTGSPPWTPFIMPEPWLTLLIGVVAGLAWWTSGVGKTARRPAEASARSPARRPSREQPGGRRSAVGSAAPRAETPRAKSESQGRRSLTAGAWTWALVSALPIAVVAPIWSAYFYLFAMAGVGLLLGSWLAGRRWLAAGVLAALAAGSHQGRMLDEFATAKSSWSLASHVNNLYLARGMTLVSHGLSDLMGFYPRLPANSTVFWAGFPSFAAFQVGDGPLVRGAYRDTSLRAYYLSDLTAARVQRGPAYFIFYDKASGRLKDHTGDSQMLLRIAIGEVMSTHPQVSEAALGLYQQSHPHEITAQYLNALVSLDLGQPARADSFFTAVGMTHSGPATEEVRKARSIAATGDTVEAILSLADARLGHVRDAALHLELAELYSRRADHQADAVVEAYAARVLDPGLARAWRRWALCQLESERGVEARASFERYFALDPAGSRADTMAGRVYATLVRRLPGGDLAQKELRRNVIR